MNETWAFLVRGGPVMIPIVLLAVALYARCFNLLLQIVNVRRHSSGAPGVTLRGIRRLMLDLPESYRQQRLLIAAMIAAAPLLGLLGTVMGMIATFDSLAQRLGARSMEGLARGVSQALITTETGLAVVLPAMLLLYVSHRQLQRAMRQLMQREAEFLEAR